MTDCDLINIARSMASAAARKNAGIDDFDRFTTAVKREYMRAITDRFSGLIAESLENLWEDIDTEDLFANR